MAFETRICCAVRGGNARALLPPVLQGVQAEIGHVGRFGMAEDAENTALVFEFVHQAIFFAKYESIAADHARSASSIDTSTVIRPPVAMRSRFPPV